MSLVPESTVGTVVKWRSTMSAYRDTDTMASSVYGQVTFSSPLGPRTLQAVHTDPTGGSCAAPICTPVAVGGEVAASQVITCDFVCSQSTTGFSSSFSITNYTVVEPSPVTVTNVTVDGETACALLTAPSVTNYKVRRMPRCFYTSKKAAALPCALITRYVACRMNSFKSCLLDRCVTTQARRRSRKPPPRPLLDRDQVNVALALPPISPTRHHRCARRPLANRSQTPLPSPT